MRILVVEDDADLAESIADVLSLKGYDLEIAATGEAAVRQYEENPHDLVFMDIMLPGENGVDSFDRIRRVHPEAKIVMMTGFGEGELIQRAVNGGALTVLAKPFGIDRMIEIIKEYTME